jgi:outer membrane protein assembly factor BamB
MLPVLLALIPFLGDVVHTRDGKKVEGRILEYETYVDVEVDPPPGKPIPKPVRILRRDILKIDLAPDFIHCPEVINFPFETIDKADYKYFAANGSILCLPQPPAKKVTAVDLRLGKKTWEMDLPNRVGELVVGGRTLFVMQRDKEVDDTKKIKINGAPFSKDVHRLTVTALDIESGQVLWKTMFDNNDRKDQLWEYLEVLPPSLHFLQDRMVIRSLKIGYPMDAAMNVDKKTSQRYVSFVSYDPGDKKILGRADSSDAAEYGGVPYFAGDQVVAQVNLGGARWKLCCVGMNNGRLRWQSDVFAQGRMLDVTEEFAYIADTATLFAYSVKNGKKDANWSIDLSGGLVAGVDLNHVYLFRHKRAPRAIVAYDVKKGTEAWKIDMPDADELSLLLFAGHRLLYTNKMNSVFCYDTLAKKEMWRWTGVGTSYASYPRVQGSSLSFYKDGRVTTLDLDTGRKIWDVKLQYQTILQAADAGIMAKQLQGTDIIRERPPAKGAVFFTPTGTPLKNAIGEDAWSVPSIENGVLTTLSSGGQLAAIDLKELKILWIQKVLTQPVTSLAPPIVHAKGVAISTGGETLLLDPEAKTKQASFKHLPLRADRQAEVTPQGMLAVSSGGAAMVDLATGQKAWETPLRGVNTHAVAGDRVYVLTSQNLQPLDLKTGAPGDVLAIPRNATLVASDGKRVWAATGPYGLIETASDTEFKPLFRPTQQDPRVAIKGFKGGLTAADGAVFYSHADGTVARFEAGAEKPTWTYETPGYTSPLLVHGGRLWFSSWGKGLYGLNLKTGVLEWNREGFRDANLFTPFVRDGKVCFWSSDGWLVATE